MINGQIKIFMQGFSIIAFKDAQALFRGIGKSNKMQDARSKKLPRKNIEGRNKSGRTRLSFETLPWKRLKQIYLFIRKLLSSKTFLDITKFLNQVVR